MLKACHATLKEEVLGPMPLQAGPVKCFSLFAFAGNG